MKIAYILEELSYQNKKVVKVLVDPLLPNCPMACFYAFVCWPRGRVECYSEQFYDPKKETFCQSNTHLAYEFVIPPRHRISAREAFEFIGYKLIKSSSELT
jgi:hypothetical protein